MFGALKNSAIALKAYYEHIMPQSSVNTFFPWITQYNTLTRPTEIQEFKYLQWMDSDGLLCICQHSHDQQQILVKFVQTYSKDAHLESAARGGAPMLLGHHNILFYGWSVVMMEFLQKPEWMSGLEIVEEVEQQMVCDKVREHVLTLHQ